MQRDGVRVFLAVAFGIGIGILTGRALPIGIGWLVGAACGGIVGYLAVAPITALRAIGQAWRAARASWPERGEWEGIRWWCYASASAFTTGVAILYLFLFAHPDVGEWEAFTRVLTPYLTAAAAFAGTAIGICALVVTTLHEPESALVQAKMGVWRLLLPIVLFYHLPHGLWWCAKQVPAAAAFFGRLARHWFRLVHSDLRVLCFADAFLFAGVGTLVGGPILAWMFIGGVFGLFNYEVVSVHFFGQRPILLRRR